MGKSCSVDSGVDQRARTDPARLLGRDVRLSRQTVCHQARHPILHPRRIGHLDDDADVVSVRDRHPQRNRRRRLHLPRRSIHPAVDEVRCSLARAGQPGPVQELVGAAVSV